MRYTIAVAFVLLVFSPLALANFRLLGHRQIEAIEHILMENGAGLPPQEWMRTLQYGDIEHPQEVIEIAHVTLQLLQMTQHDSPLRPFNLSASRITIAAYANFDLPILTKILDDVSWLYSSDKLERNLLSEYWASTEHLSQSLLMIYERAGRIYPQEINETIRAKIRYALSVPKGRAREKTQWAYFFEILADDFDRLVGQNRLDDSGLFIEVFNRTRKNGFDRTEASFNKIRDVILSRNCKEL